MKRLSIGSEGVEANLHGSGRAELNHIAGAQHSGLNTAAVKVGSM
jgi:hypothetical protein